MILGAGSCQLNAIKRIKELGYTAVVSDPSPVSPGKVIGDIAVLADTFSYEETVKEARNQRIDAIFTSGTDQPVLTVNKVAENLDLRKFLSVESALWVTNKKYMKERFIEFEIPTTAYALCRKDFQDADLDDIKAPYVIKPLDSQGQRGIYKVNSIKEIRMYFDDVLQYSREEEILVESYYRNQEVTVTGWVQDGLVHTLSITDRVTFDSDEHIGVCIAHDYPSKHLDLHRDTFMTLTTEICKVFNINAGPIYFQYLVGESGVLVNEIACRIGGAYEDVFIPAITGVDLLGLNILSLVDTETEIFKGFRERIKKYIYREDGLRVSVQLFFCKKGIVQVLTPIEALLKRPYILDMGYNIAVGDSLASIENASQRAGYIIITGDSEEALQSNIEASFAQMKVIDENGRNLVIEQRREYR